MVPKWSHNPEELLVEKPEYELAQVPLTSISFVTARTIKVKRRSVSTTMEKPRERLHGFVSTLWHALVPLGGAGLDRGTPLCPSHANNPQTS